MIDMTNPKEIFRSDVLEFCGCMDETIIDDIVDTLKCFKKEPNDCYYTDISSKLHLTTKYIELILCILDEKGLIEHGTAVRASWLTDYGKRILNELREE